MTLNKTDNKELSKSQSKPGGNSNHRAQSYNSVTLALQYSRKHEYKLHENWTKPLAS